MTNTIEQKENIGKAKSKAFAVRVVNLYKYLCEVKNEKVLSKQVLRSGTSIGANLAEAETAITLKEFNQKVYIALKETSETIYWLELLRDTSYISQEEFASMYKDCEELRRILSATTCTTNKKLNKGERQ